jgi:hypothetical protein
MTALFYFLFLTTSPFPSLFFTGALQHIFSLLPLKREPASGHSLHEDAAGLDDYHLQRETPRQIAVHYLHCSTPLCLRPSFRGRSKIVIFSSPVLDTTKYGGGQ